jgi:hypothetical protein
MFGVSRFLDFASLKRTRLLHPIVNHLTRMKRLVCFFNFALKDGHFMSRPVYNPQQSLIGEVIHSLERLNPRFAWIQILFARHDYNHLLLHTKTELENYIAFANSPEYDKTSGEKIRRKEARSQWCKLATSRIRKIEQTLSKPTFSLAINGMWVSGEMQASSDCTDLVQELPFSFCSDDTDRLIPFVYHDPRLLKMLVERRMVTDVSPSVYRYSASSREEPPSLILTPEELPHYIHMPAGPSARALTTIRPAAHFPSAGTLKAQKLTQVRDEPKSPIEKDDAKMEREAGRVVAELKRIPVLEEALDEEDEAPRLSQLIPSNPRTFELIYDSEGTLEDGTFKPKPLTSLLLSSSGIRSRYDLEEVYIPKLESIYGKLDYQILQDNRPGFLMDELPKMLSSDPNREFSVQA